MQKNKFIIYLDIDGVLVSYLNLKSFNDIDGKHNFLKNAVEALNNIINLFNADLCILSTWARNNNIEYITDILKTRGVIVNNLTIGDIDYRAEYVIKNIQLGFTKFLIIDDESLSYYKNEKQIGFNRIISTNPYRGLDNYDYEWVLFNYNRLISDYPNKY